MIRNKKELKEYLAYEKALYFGGKKGSRLQAWLLRSKFYRIWQFLWTLRQAEYHKNRSACGGRSPRLLQLWDKMAFIWYHRRKYVLGNRLGFEIPENCFDKGLMIYHIAPIVVNEDARIGADCRITGNFCIGNTGAGTKSPVLGKGITAGWGASVIGDIRIADGVTIGAGSVVVHNVLQEGATVAGVPGKVLHLTE